MYTPLLKWKYLLLLSLALQTPHPLTVLAAAPPLNSCFIIMLHSKESSHQLAILMQLPIPQDRLPGALF